MATRRAAVHAHYHTARPSGGKPQPTGTAPVKAHHPGMNKTETRFAERLDALLVAGRIVWYQFEFLSIKLAENTHYKPDFIVQYPDGALHLFEVKGARGADYMTTEGAWVKLKVVARQLPIPLTVVWQTKDHHWHEERLN